MGSIGIIKNGQEDNPFLMKNILLLIAAIIYLSACQVGPRYHPPSTDVPEGWKNTEAIDDTGEELPENWWEIFNDVLLNQFEELALENNHNLYAAVERVRQARAIAGIAESKLYPQLNLEPYFLSREILWMIYDPVRVIREHRRRNELPAVLDFEVDLWGKLQKAKESALLNVEAEADVLQTALLFLTTDVASSYFQIRTLDSELQLLQETIEARKKAYQLILSRYKGQIISKMDVERAKLEYENTQAEYFKLVNEREMEENRLAVLIGAPASEFVVEKIPLNKSPPPQIPPGLPSDLLLRRPDIAAAERKEASTHALINVAYAEFFPSLSLTGALGYSSPELKDFLHWKSRLLLAGANSTQMIYDAGNLESNLQLAVSRFRETDQIYRQIVLEAFQQVEDSLSTIEELDNAYGKLEESVKAAKKMYDISSVRFTKGATFYLDVVDSERQLLLSESDLIGLQGERYEAAIQLIRVLGGTWHGRTDCD